MDRLLLLVAALLLHLEGPLLLPVDGSAAVSEETGLMTRTNRDLLLLETLMPNGALPDLVILESTPRILKMALPRPRYIPEVA